MKAELLTPAGSPEALRAAIAAGADAVYLGAAAFGARATAGFDDAALSDAIRLAHLYGVRVYVTVNTLIKPQEMDGLRALLTRLQALRADALIVQDVGLAGLIKAEFPGLCLHASTQMSVHNAHGARILKDLGISRVVLARECTPEDIRAVASTGIQTEVFVHGAMCVSVSGQCLFSSHIGGRSGNRGKCAQPCRLQYRYRDQSGALLSMHDMNTLAGLPELLGAGAGSFKIEGRLKRPEYVYIVTSIYRRALDRAARGEPLLDLRADEEALSQIFSRGFTRGHAFGAQDAALIGPERVSHLGIRLGRVTAVQQRDGFALAKVILERALNNQDGLQTRGSAEQDCIYSGPPVPKGQAATLRLRQAPAIGDSVWRLQDESQLAAARQGAMKLPRLDIAASLFAAPGEAARLSVKCGQVSVETQGGLAHPAQNQPLDAESARRLIGKTGGTPFTLDQLDVISPSPAFLTASALNALRRDALAALEEALIAQHPLPGSNAASIRPDQRPNEESFEPRLLAIVNAGADIDALHEAGLSQAITYLDNYRDGFLQEGLQALGPSDILLLPRQINDRDLETALRLAREGRVQLMADNIGQLGVGAAIAGEGIPVWNEAALRVLLAMGIRSAVLSRELSGEEVAALPRGLMELIFPVYGRAGLMLLNHCPERQSRGLSKSKAGCALCARGQGLRGQVLIDRLDARYPLVPTHFDDTCLIALYHHTPTHLSTLAPRMSWLMDLRLESAEDALRITRLYASLLRGEAADDIMPQQPGRYLAGVE